MSHLLQMRGLKPGEKIIESMNVNVASFTDAWIETWKKNKESGQVEVASFTDAWIETPYNTTGIRFS